MNLTLNKLNNKSANSATLKDKVGNEIKPGDLIVYYSRPNYWLTFGRISAKKWWTDEAVTFRTHRQPKDSLQSIEPARIIVLPRVLPGARLPKPLADSARLAYDYKVDLFRQPLIEGQLVYSFDIFHGIEICRILGLTPPQGRLTTYSYKVHSYDTNVPLKNKTRMFIGIQDENPELTQSLPKEWLAGLYGFADGSFYQSLY